MIEFKTEKDQEAFRQHIKNISEVMTQLDWCREQINDIIHVAGAMLDIPKPLIRKVARLYHTKTSVEFEATTSEIKNLCGKLKSA
jgi:hypothetical protein